MVVGVLMLVAVGAWLLPSPPSYPSDRMTGWKLDYGYGGPGFDPTTAQTTTVIPVEVTRPTCAPNDVSWLATPVVTYTPVSVIIQLRMSDTFDSTKCYPVDSAGRRMIGAYLSGIYLAVHLSEPLRGRALFDGSTSPPAARPYP